MKRLLLLSLITAILVSGCLRQSVQLPQEYHDQKDETRQKNLETYETFTENYAGNDAVYIFNNSYYDHYGDTDPNFGSLFYKFTSHKKYVVLNNDKSEFKNFIHPLIALSTINDIKVIITFPDGKTQRFSKDDFTVVKESKFLSTLILDYPDVSEGTVIEEYISVTSDGIFSPMEFEFPMQFKYPCLKRKVQFAYPDWMKTQIKETPQLKNIKIDKIENDKFSKKIYTFQDSMINGASNEIYSPYPKNFQNFIDIQFNNPTVHEKTWNSVSTDYVVKKLYYKSDEPEPDENILKTILVNCPPTTLDSVKTIIEYIQKNYSRVETSKSSLAICGMAKIMVEYTSANAKLVFLHSGTDGIFDKNYLTMKQFPLPALRIEIGNKIKYVLPYENFAPINMLPTSLSEEEAILIEPSSWVGYFIKLPKNIFKSAKLEEDIKITIDENGSVNVKENKTYFDLSALELRNQLDLLGIDIEKFVKSLTQYKYGDINLIDYNFSNLDDIYKPLSIEINYKVENAISITPGKFDFKAGEIFSPKSFFKEIENPESRINPIQIMEEDIIEKNIEISFPENWKLATELENIEIENTFGIFKSDFDVINNKIKFTQSKHLKKTYQPKEKFGELLNILVATSKFSASNLVFEKVEQDQPIAPEESE